MKAELQQKISRCASYNIDRYNNLKKEDMKNFFLLPCGCEQASIEQLIESYQCSKCEIKYLYSLCLGEVVTEESTWGCEFCGNA